MQTFKIEIIETLSKIIEIEAETQEEAIEIANDRYSSDDDEFILDWDDKIDAEINLYEE